MRQVPILMYHWFAADGAPASRSPQLVIEPDLFARQMDWLRSRGYETVPLAAAIGAGPPLPRRPIVITFDDGTADFWDHARPVLKEAGFTATLFVVTGFVGGRSTWDEALGEPARDLLTWEQIDALAAEGYEIGSHTHTHRVLTTLTAEDARDEIVRSRDILMERLGSSRRFLAYPRGFYDPEHAKMVRDAGYAGTCAVILRWRDLRRADPFQMQRMTIKGTEGFGRFRLRVALAGVVPLAKNGAG